jgi:hypothetical protein
LKADGLFVGDEFGQMGVLLGGVVDGFRHDGGLSRVVWSGIRGQIAGRRRKERAVDGEDADLCGGERAGSVPREAVHFCCG